MFEVDISMARKHIYNIYKDDELQEIPTSAKFTLVQNEGGRSVIRLTGTLDKNIVIGGKLS